MNYLRKSAFLAVLALVIGLLSVAGTATTAQAAAADQAAPTVELTTKTARINKDGSVVIRWRSNCPSTYQGFAYYVRVSQPSGNTYFDVTAAGALTCDGKTRVIRTKTAPAEGKVRRGRAEVEVAAFYYDTIEGNDTEARDSGTVTLRRRC